jgi:hypothetical protein
MGGKCANWGQASHRGHGGHRGGSIMGERLRRYRGLLARNAGTGKTPPRVTEVKKGILGLGSISFLCVSRFL